MRMTAMMISLNTKNVKLRVKLSDCITDGAIPLDGKELKVILYKPDGTKEEKLESDGVTKVTDNGIDYISWVDDTFSFDVRGTWEYAGFADIESPVKSIFWVI
jgi:hypothetical protein